MSRTKASFWSNEIKQAVNAAKSWLDQSDGLNKKYSVSSAGAIMDQDTASYSPAYNIFFSNVETLRGALKIDDPKPYISRRIEPEEENKIISNTYLKASEVLERAMSYYIDTNNVASIFDGVLFDALVSGRGAPWLVYESEVKTDEEGNALEVQSQEFKIDYVNYQDIILPEERRDEEIQWIARRRLMTKEDVEKSFGKKAVSSVSFNYKKGEEKKESSSEKRACIYEIWDKQEKNRIYYADNAEIIQIDKDPYQLKDFFPCKPLRFIRSSVSNIPTPEYNIYQKKAAELERICARRSSLVEAAKANGFVSGRYAGNMADLSTQPDGSYIAVEGLVSKSGGIEGLVWERNLSNIDTIISRLTDYEANITNQIYQITGISDIMRGSNDPRATATAEGLKGKFGSLRLVRRQEELQSCIRDMFYKMAQVISEHATIETLREISGIKLPSNIEKVQKIAQINMMMQVRSMQEGTPMGKPKELVELEETPTWEDVKNLLSNNKMRSYVLDIETNITAFDDERSMNEAIDNLFVSFTSMISQASPIIMQAPELLPVYKEMILSKVRAAKAGRTLEASVDKSFDALKKKIDARENAPQEAPQPDPNKVLEIQSKERIEQMKSQQKGQSDLMRLQQDSQALNADMQKHSDNIKQETRRLDITEQNNLANQGLKSGELNAELSLQARALAMGGNPSGNLGV